MDLLSLELIGWVYCVCCTLALLAGSWVTLSVYATGAEGRKALAARLLDDLVLYTIWLAGLAGGLGVLMEKAWSRGVLELFCWVLVFLCFMSGYGRWRATPPPRTLLILSLTLFFVPVLLFCAATILSLRGETALSVLVR